MGIFGVQEELSLPLRRCDGLFYCLNHESVRTKSLLVCGVRYLLLDFIR